MQIGSKLQYIVPDTCPKTCAYALEPFYRGCTCSRCPVICCNPIKILNSNETQSAMVDPQGFRDDWAKEWEEFFKTGKYPELRLYMENIDEH